MIELHRYFSAISSTRSPEDATSGINQIGISERENSHEVEWLRTVEIRIGGLGRIYDPNYNRGSVVNALKINANKLIVRYIYIYIYIYIYLYLRI